MESRGRHLCADSAGGGTEFGVPFALGSGKTRLQLKVRLTVTALRMWNACAAAWLRNDSIQTREEWNQWSSATNPYQHGKAVDKLFLVGRRITLPWIRIDARVIRMKRLT